MFYATKVKTLKSFLSVSISGGAQVGGRGRGPPERNKNDDLDAARHFNLFAQMSFQTNYTHCRK